MIGKISGKNDRLFVVENLSFTLQDKPILADLSFSLPKGKMSVLIGPNGAGKSTLMRLLSGYLPLQSGFCRFLGRPLQDFSQQALAKRRAVMKQHSQLNFPYSAEEIIRMGGYLRRPQEVERCLPQVLAATECEHLRGKAYGRLSGGEQQRVQLARALLQLWADEMADKILFLDEPTSAFDLYYQQHCLRMLKQLCDGQGLTVCAILHDLNLASLYADKVLLLAESRLQAEGTPEIVINETNIRRYYHADIGIVPHFQLACPQVALYR